MQRLLGFVLVLALSQTVLAQSVLIGGKPYTAALGKENLKKDVKIELTVEATGATKNGGLFFLNSSKKRDDENAITVVLNKDGQKAFKDMKVEDLKAHFQGKRIEVTGTMSEFMGKYQIMVSKADQVKVLDK